MGPSEPRRRCDSRLARIPQGVAPSRGTQPHSDGGWPTIDMEGLGRGPWSKTEEKTVNGGRSTGGGGHAGLVAARAISGQTQLVHAAARWPFLASGESARRNWPAGGERHRTESDAVQVSI